MFYNRESVYYILMTNISPNTNTQSCNHPSNKIVLTPEGEYVCSICGVVLTLDEAVERRVYASREAVGYIDPHGKTNPWLLGLGSVIPKRGEGKRLAEIAESKHVNGEEYSRLANVIESLRLYMYGQQIVYSFSSYNKSEKDHLTSAYIAVKKVVLENNLPITDKRIREVIKTHFGSNVRFIPNNAIKYVSNLAKLYGAKTASRVRKYRRARKIYNLLNRR